MQNKLLQLNATLIKGAWKEVMRQGIKYYATGPHAGKIVGSIRGSKATVDSQPQKKTPAPAPKVEEKKELQEEKTSDLHVDQFQSQTPERSGTKTAYVAEIIGTGPHRGKRSVVEYKSPKGSTCNLVGHVAFGKTSQQNQHELNERLRNAEIVLSHMGIRFKTPVDFVCQQLKQVKFGTQATFTTMKNTAALNNRITISKGNSIQKSLMHEIGHALDYSLSMYDSFRTSETMTIRTDEVSQLYKSLAEVVRSSDYYRETKQPFAQYLNQPTEVFARAFEVYAYAKGKKLIEERKLSPRFVEQFRPDVFKAKDRELEAIRNEMKVISENPTPDIDKYVELGERASAIKNSTGGWIQVDPAKQEEYSNKIVDLMDQILSLDKVKKAMTMLSLVDTLRKGGDSTFYVAVVPVNPDGKVLLGERREDGIWTTPCGGAEAGENPLDVAVRECWEESGLHVDRDRLELLSLKAAPNGKPVYCYLYRTAQLNTTTKLDPDKEVRAWQWMSVEEFPSALQRKKNRNRLETVNEALMKFHGLMKSQSDWVEVGTKVEMEHTNDKSRAKKIALDHLAEDPDYYKDWDAKEKILFQPKAPEMKKALADKLIEKGGPGSGQLGHKTYRPENERPKNKLQTHLKALKDGGAVPGIQTKSGKPIVTAEEAMRAHRYSKDDHMDAVNAHHDLASRVRGVMSKLTTAGRKLPSEAAKIAEFHEKQMRKHMREYDSIEMAEARVEAAKEEKRNPKMKKAMDLIAKLEKGAWKEVMRQGVKYYATGPHAGKIVGSIRGNKPKASESAPSSKPVAKPAEESKDNKKFEKVLAVVNKMEAEGKGFFNRNSDGSMSIFIRGAHGNDPNQWKHAREVQDALGVYGTDIKPDPQSGHLVMRVPNVYKNAAGLVKSITQMGSAFGDPDLNTGEFSQAKANMDQGLMERFYRGMENFDYGDLPREFGLDKGTLHLSKVDDGMYSGYFTTRDANGLEDNARVRIDKINIPDLAALIQAKEWMNQVAAPTTQQPMEKEFNEGGVPAAFSESAPQPEAMPTQPQAPDSSRPDKVIRILSLIDKLIGG